MTYLLVLDSFQNETPFSRSGIEGSLNFKPPSSSVEAKALLSKPSLEQAAMFASGRGAPNWTREGRISPQNAPQKPSAPCTICSLVFFCSNDCNERCTRSSSTQLRCCFMIHERVRLFHFCLYKEWSVSAHVPASINSQACICVCLRILRSKRVSACVCTH